MGNSQAVKEARKLSVRKYDKLLDMIKELDKPEMLELFKEFSKDKKGFHDFMQGFANILMGRLVTHGGDEVVWEAMKEYARFGYPPFIREFIDKYEKGEAKPEDFPFDEFIKNRAIIWEKNHDNVQIWEEDGDVVKLSLSPCESGGQIVRETAPEKIAVTKEPHWWCYNKKGFQVYCLNCTTMWEFGWYEWFGWPLIIFDVPEIGSDGTCVYTIYKDPKKIPDSYYKKRGIKRKV